MAATKSTKTKSTKTTSKTKVGASKTTVAKKVSKTTVAKKPSKTTVTKKVSKTTVAKKPKKTTQAKKTTRASKTTTRTSTKRKTSVAKKSKSVVNVFLVDVVKQASKVEKKAQAETKVWIKKLNAQDKALNQLTKKINKAKGRTRTSLDNKITKLQSEMSVTRTGLLAAENGADKVATFIEWTTQLSSKPSTTAYLQSSSHSSKPKLVSGVSPYNEEEEYPEESEEEINFLFGEDEDEEATR